MSRTESEKDQFSIYIVLSTVPSRCCGPFQQGLFNPLGHLIKSFFESFRPHTLPLSKQATFPLSLTGQPGPHNNSPGALANVRDTP